jgi:hypothetical protein
MKHIKLYESFTIGDFDPEMISEQEYQRVKKSGIHLRFSTRDVARLYTNAKVFDPRIVSWIDGNSRGYIGGTFNQVIKNVELNFSTRFEIITIEKEDEPFVYFTINWGYRNSMVSWRDTLNFPPDSKLYGRMEYEEFEMVREDAKIWKDFCVNIVVEEDRKTNKIIQESFGGSIPDPEPMDVNEWDEEVTNAQEVAFTQKEKELFISLSDSISLENKINQPEIARYYLAFRLINGNINPKIRETAPISNVATYKNDDEFYYVSVWKLINGDGFEKLYRCDGYECWEKFLKEIFASYRKLISKQTKTNESIFTDIPDPEIMTLDEYDDEINNGKEEKFNQKEKELFISLSDTIPLQHKPYSPEFWDSQISFSLTNGGQLVPDRPKSYGGVYLELKSTDVIRSITTYKNEDEFYYVNVWEKEWATEDHNGTKSYRCDGYACWEKFLKEIFQDYRDLINTKDNKVIKESFGGPIPDPEPMDENEWDKEVTNAEEIPFTQKEKELFIALSDTISVKNKRNMPEIGISNLFFQLLNGDLNPKLRETTPISNISIYKNDDEFYFVGLWSGDGMFAERELWAGGEKLYRCDGYECWEKFLKEIFAGYRDLINTKSKTNESYFDEVSEPKSLLDENGDYIPGSSRASMNNREPFNKKEKSFINQLLETLNEEYVSTNFSDNTEFALNMGEMGETTHGMRIVKLTDDYYEVQYNNFVDSDDEYIYCECDGFKCLSKLLIRLFEKINKDYDYEGD